MAKTVVLYIRPGLYALLKAEISQWVLDRTLEGWTVRILLTTATTGYQSRADLAAQAPFDHLFIVGDSPMVYYKFNLDGHGERWLPAPYFLVNTDPQITANRIPGTDNCAIPVAFQPAYAAVGWLSFDGLYGDPAGNKPGLTDAEIIDQYRKCFARMHANSFQDVALRSILIDHFMGAGGYGISCEQEWTKFPGAIHHWNPLAPNDDDGQAVLEQDAMTYGVFTGGIDPGWLFYWSNFQKVRDYPVESPIVHTWGSYECDVMTSDLSGKMIPSPISMLRWLLVDKPLPTSKPARAICSVYNYAGQFKWSVFLNGGTIGEAGLASVARYALPICSVHGDPTIRLDSMSLQNLDLDNRVAALEAGLKKAQSDIATLETSGPSGTGGNPDGGGPGTPPGPTVLAWNLGGPTVGAFAGVSGQNFTAPNAASVAGVANAAPAAVYQTGWTGLSFSFLSTNVPPGTYTILLHGTEPTGQPGGREQVITVNGIVIPKFDFGRVAGVPNKAAVVSATVVVAADGRLAVSGTSNGPTDRNTWLCGIELKAA